MKFMSEILREKISEQNESEKEKFYPIGSGKEGEPKETLPAIEVKNEVSWINPRFPRLPFDLKEGKPTKLGLFLTPEKEPKKAYPLKILGEHYRSALLGQVIFQDGEGRLYRDIDLKGAGYIDEFGKGMGKVEPRGKKEACGILDEPYVLSAIEMCEKFLKMGIRTERYLAIIQLKEIVNKNGKKITIKEAKERGMIPENINPVLGLRAFGIKARIGNADPTTLEDARKMVAQELGIKNEEFPLENYFEWYVKIMGQNIGLMHKNKYYHNYLGGHNLTLDCRIVDLDSVCGFHFLKKEKKEKKIEEDYYYALGYGLHYLYEKIESSSPKIKDFFHYKKLFKQAYVESLGYRPNFLNKENRD